MVGVVGSARKKHAPWDQGSRRLRRWWNREDRQSDACQYVDLGRLANGRWFLLHLPSQRWQQFENETEAMMIARRVTTGWTEVPLADEDGEDEEPGLTPQDVYGPGAW